MESSSPEDIFTLAGVRPTAMRLWVYRTLQQCHHPISLRQMEERMGSADRSTIFRTLTLLLQHHLIHSVDDGTGSLKYEACTSPRHHTHPHELHDDLHVHFHCEACQRTFCLPQVGVPQVELPQGVKVYSVNYVVKGLCPLCRAKRGE